MARDPLPLCSPSPHHALAHPHPLFTCSLHHPPLLTQHQQLETPSHLLCAFKTGYILAVLLRMSTPDEQDQGESERAPGDQNGLPVIRIAQPPPSLVFNCQCYSRTEIGILPCNASLIQLLVATLHLLNCLVLFFAVHVFLKLSVLKHSSYLHHRGFCYSLPTCGSA